MVVGHDHRGRLHVRAQKVHLLGRGRGRVQALCRQHQDRSSCRRRHPRHHHRYRWKAVVVVADRGEADDQGDVARGGWQQRNRRHIQSHETELGLGLQMEAPKYEGNCQLAALPLVRNE